MKTEIWKDISGTEGKYQVSNLGNVRSFTSKNLNGNLIKQSRRSKNIDYLVVCMRRNGRKHIYAVHKLVAEAFVENPLSLSVVNHIDGNKQNNSAENLEWTTAQGNKIHAVYTGLDIPPFGIKPVICVTTGVVYQSASQAERVLGISDSSVSKVCRGERISAKGLKFKYITKEAWAELERRINSGTTDN